MSENGKKTIVNVSDECYHTVMGNVSNYGNKEERNE